MDGEAGERPARARHCDRAKPVARHAAATGREAGKARRESSEARRPPSDPSTSIALVERGQGMRKQRSRRSSSPSFISSSSAPAAQAAPTEVNVRIEGKAETLFEGPILTDGHNVKATSDTKAPEAGRRCNGLNNGAEPDARADPDRRLGRRDEHPRRRLRRRTGTRAVRGLLHQALGPRRARTSAPASTGASLVNNVFTSVGGCQYQLDGGDEVLWVYDAFSGRPRLAALPRRLLGRRRAADRDRRH